MTILLWILAVLALAAVASWVYLALFRGMFWRTNLRLDTNSLFHGRWPRVAVIVPARDESESLPATLPSLLRQDYPGTYHVFLVDDGSSDGTADAALSIARMEGMEGRLRVSRTRPLPEGWTGKLWALQQGLSSTVGYRPRYLLLTDADIVHPPDSLRLLVTKALNEDLDIVSVMARLRTQTLWERLLMPAFVFLFAMLYPFRWVAQPEKSTAAAAGGCMLVRRIALERAGGFRTVAGRLIDDCALAALLKKSGSNIWLGYYPQVRSVRGYEHLGGVWRMVTRTAYEALSYSPPLLVGTLLALGVVFVVPPVATAVGIYSLIVDWPGSVAAWIAAVGGFIAWETMSNLYYPVLKHQGQHREHGLLLPFVVTLYLLMTLHAGVRRHLGRGAEWKGRRMQGRIERGRPQQQQAEQQAETGTAE